MKWRVVCDFDGTIAVEDVTDSLLGRFADPAWTHFEVEWRSGRIGSRECMASQTALIRATRAELDEHLDSIHIDPYFPDFAALCQRADIPLTVVSDGLDYAIRRILGRHGLGDLDVVSNCLVAVADDRYRLAFPNARGDCRAASGTCKCAVFSAVPRAHRTILIGDGASDFCAAIDADFVFAKGSLLDHCMKNALAHEAFSDFGEVRERLCAFVGIQDPEAPARPPRAITRENEARE
jgi:2,3-diketo-5-methylthio-1-phosphopentane phosphatase